MSDDLEARARENSAHLRDMQARGGHRGFGYSGETVALETGGLMPALRVGLELEWQCPGGNRLGHITRIDRETNLAELTFAARWYSTDLVNGRAVHYVHTDDMVGHVTRELLGASHAQELMREEVRSNPHPAAPPPFQVAVGQDVPARPWSCGSDS